MEHMETCHRDPEFWKEVGRLSMERLERMENESLKK